MQPHKSAPQVLFSFAMVASIFALGIKKFTLAQETALDCKVHPVRQTLLLCLLTDLFHLHSRCFVSTALLAVSAGGIPYHSLPSSLFRPLPQTCEVVAEITGCALAPPQPHYPILGAFMYSPICLFWTGAIVTVDLRRRQRCRWQ